ncbi:MAG TPA: alginate export family protein [Stellaceae bacterium]|nr:alginate export family protein [Stellaceae bacterium]
MQRWPGAAVLAFVAITASTSPALAQSGAARTPYQQLRYNDDFTYLADPVRRDDVWDPLKYIRLGDKPDYYLTLGGELRERYGHYDQPSFGLRRRDQEDYLFHRLLLSADLHLGDSVRSFVELGNGLQAGRGSLRQNSDLDRLDLQQAFVDVSTPLDDAASATLRTGRQEMAFGSQRLVSLREGRNVRRSFDGFRSFYRAGDMRIDAFITRPVQEKPGIFDDQPNHSQLFGGVYAVLPVAPVPSLTADLYYLGLDRKNASFDVGTAHELRHTIGTRLWGRPQAWDYNSEFVLQTGSFGKRDILAWLAASDTGYTFAQAPLTPRLGLKANVASGNRNPQNGTLGTFNGLYPRNGYFTPANLVVLTNLVDFYPSVTIRPTAATDVALGWDFLWRESTKDAFYRGGHTPLIPGNSSAARYLGNDVDLEAGWQLDRHVRLAASYVHFFAGPFITNGGGKDVDYTAVSVAYRF